MNARIPPFGAPSRPLRVEELLRRLLSHAAYTRVRAERSEAHIAMRGRRRIRVGASISLLFENLETVILQVYEVLRVEGWTEQRAIRELSAYTCLLPHSRSLRATAFVDGGSPLEGLALAELLSTRGGLILRFGGHRVPSTPSDAASPSPDPVRYLRWDFSQEARKALLEWSEPVVLELGDHEEPAACVLSPTLALELKRDLLQLTPTSSLLAPT